MRLIFASPTYGPVDPQAARSQRLAIMHAARNGHEWVGDASPDRMKFDAAREAVAQAAILGAIEAQADGIFWCDSDVLLPQDGITRLAHHKLDFVTGIYFQRVSPHWPLIATYDEHKDVYQWIVGWPEKAVVPVDGCGFGCVLTSRAMLEAIGERAFQYEKFSEDFDFCRKAARAGYQLFCDTSVLCGHLAEPRPVTLEVFRAAHPELGGINGSEESARDVAVQ